MRRHIEDSEQGRYTPGLVPTMEQLRRVGQDWLEVVLAPLAKGLLYIGASANQVSIGGLALNVAAAALIVADQLVAAGVLYLFASSLDLLDGVLARLAGTPGRFGAFLDSTLDRISEGVVFAAIAFRFALEGAALDAGIVVLALLGSFLVSYARARAEALGAECRVGIATRPERVVLLAAGLLTGLLTPAIYLLVVLTAITVAQRIIRTRHELRSDR